MVGGGQGKLLTAVKLKSLQISNMHDHLVCCAVGRWEGGAAQLLLRAGGHSHLAS